MCSNHVGVFISLYMGMRAVHAVKTENVGVSLCPYMVISAALSGHAFMARDNRCICGSICGQEMRLRFKDYRWECGRVMMPIYGH